MDPIDQTDTARNTAEMWDILNKSGTPYGDLTVVDRDNRIDASSESPLSDQIDFFTSGVSHDATTHATDCGQMIRRRVFKR